MIDSDTSVELKAQLDERNPARLEALEKLERRKSSATALLAAKQKELKVRIRLQTLEFQVYVQTHARGKRGRAEGRQR